MNPSEANAYQAESALLANMMLATTIKTEELEGINPSDFLDERHGLIWSAISAEVRSGGTDAPSLVVVDRLQALGALETAGGFKYINSFGAWSIGHRLPSVEACAEIIKQAVVMRRLSNAAKALAFAADGHGGEPGAAVVVLKHAISRSEETEKTGAQSAWHALTFDLAGTFREHYRTLTPIDKALPLSPGRLYIIGGRTGHGKTTMAIQLALSMLRANPDLHALMASCEMTEPELSLKALCCLDGRDFISEVRSVGPASLVNVQMAVAQHAPVLERLHIKRTRSMADITGEAHAIGRKYRLGCIVVDYVQAMVAMGSEAENRAIEVGRVSRACKELSMDLDCVVLAAAQLNRGAAKDGTKPMLSHFKDSGSIEQDADGCMLLHRPDHDSDEAAAQLIIAKSRWGEQSTLDLAPDLARHRFGWGT